MQKKLLQDASKFLARNHRRRSWRKRVGALACAVVVATGGMLTHPAMTLERAAECGMTEHVHTEDCYALSADAGKAVLVCTPERLGLHQHTEACQNERGELICGYSDFVVHQHGDSCYDENGALQCSLPEVEVHIHDENCYSAPETGAASEHTHTPECYEMQRGDLICGQSAEGHVHTEECYQDRETLVCPIVAEHHHDESCYDENGIVACGMEEGDGHVHGAECYETTRELVCGYGDAAHEHTDDCYTWIMEPTCGFSTGSTEPELICGKEEVLLHEHTDTCFDADGNVICGQMQVLEHVHTDDCFQVVEPVDAKTLVCGMEEHTHTEECYGGSSSESGSGEEPEDTGAAAEPAEESETAAVAGESETTLTGDTGTEGKSETTLTGDAETEEKPETDPAGDTETEEKPETDPTGDTETEKKPETDPAGDTETEEETETELAGDTESESGSGTETDGVVEETEGTTESESETETEGVTESESETETEGVTESETETESDAETVEDPADASGISVPASTGLSLPHRRVIDAFGDGVENPDTTLDETAEDNSNLYRQYLDVTGAAEPMDVLFVVDGSADTDESVNAAEACLKGDDGLIADILAMNAENRVAVYAANGAEELSQVPVTVPESETAADAIAAPDPAVASDSETASAPADASDLTASPDSEITPDLAATSDAEAALDPAAASEPVTSPAPAAAPETDTSVNKSHGVVLVDWTAEKLSEELSLAAVVKEEREQASGGSAEIGRAEELFLAEAVKENGHKKVVVFLDSDALAEDRVDNVSYINASTGDQESVVSQLKALSMPEAVSITDQLSVYTELCGEQTDYKVTMEDADGVATALYESGIVTEAGNGIVKEVVFDEETRTVSAVFCEDYRLQPGYRYTLSFNTTVSGQAYEEYSESGYPSQGDADTDYAANQSSSGQMGFYVDDEALVSYQAGGVPYLEDYDKPVMQIAEMDIMMTADGDAGSGSVSKIGVDLSAVTLDPHKTIDAFRDGADNPDTTLDDPLHTLEEKAESNLYRLYLDATAPPKRTKPTALVLVLDNSYSMFCLDPEGKKEGTWGFTSRNTVMNNALLDFIPKFLKACPGNQISIVYFSGPANKWSEGFNGGDVDDLDPNIPVTYGQRPNTTKVEHPNIEGLEKDAWEGCDWTTSEDVAKGALLQECKSHEKTTGVNHHGGAGTNYAAGLEKAKEYLDSADSQHDVAMMFISDGVATHFIREDKKRGGDGLSSEYANDAEGVANGIENETYCQKPTENAIDSFKAQYKYLPLYSVSFCTKGVQTRADGTTFDYDYALRRMPQNGGSFYPTSTADGLKSALGKLIEIPVSNVSITDNLSEYVDLYTTQPDYKVTMTNVEDGTVKVLYENGAITADGQGVLESVGLDEDDPSGKTVSAVFNPNYKLEKGWRYTLSFNVIASQQAHNKFKENKEKGSKPYGDTTGDKETDYPGNATSSGQEGFHSNETATLKYQVEGASEPNTEFYDHPVIQVRDTTVTVEKKWFRENNGVLEDITSGKTNGSITFDLIQTGYEIKSDEVKNVDVDVYYPYTDWYGDPQTEPLGGKPVKDGSMVTIKFESYSKYSREYPYLSIGEKTISKKDLTVVDETYGSITYSYTFPISGKTTVYINDSRQPSSCEIIGEEYTPSGGRLVQFGEPAVYDTYTIEYDEKNGWKKDIKNLPTSGTVNGKDVWYTYKVEERANSSYDTTYDNNDGVTSGTITINNTEKPNYELPETGGSGTTTLYTIGGLLTAFAGLLLLYNDRKRRKEGFASFDAQQFR